MKGAPYPERFLEACRLVLSIFGDGGAVTVTGTGPHLKQGQGTGYQSRQEGTN